jgi:hypothetical protein
LPREAARIAAGGSAPLRTGLLLRGLDYCSSAGGIRCQAPPFRAGVTNSTTDACFHYNNVRRNPRLNLARPCHGARTLSADKTIRRVTHPQEQQSEADRYWQSVPVGARLSAVWEVSAAAYAFAAAFKRTPHNDAGRPQRTITRIQRSRS